MRNKVRRLLENLSPKFDFHTPRQFLTTTGCKKRSPPIADWAKGGLLAAAIPLTIYCCGGGLVVLGCGWLLSGCTCCDTGVRLLAVPEVASSEGLYFGALT